MLADRVEGDGPHHHPAASPGPSVRRSRPRIASGVRRPRTAGSGFVGACGAMLVYSAAVAQEVPLHTVHVQHAGRSVEVRVNGLPVARGEPDRPSLVAQVSSFVTDGSNEIELISIRRGPASSPLSFVLRRRTSEGSIEVASLPDLEGEPAGKPVARTLEVDVKLPVTWSWERAEEVGSGALSATDRTEVVEAVRALHAALAARRVDEVVDRLRIVYREMGLLRPGIVERIRQRVADWMGDPGWRLAPLDAGRLRIRPYGKLVHVSSDGPLIESGPLGDGTSRFRLESVFLAKLDGRWVIVRRGV